MKALMSSNFGQKPLPTPELSAPYGNGKNLNNLALSFLIGCSSFLQVTRKFGQIGLRPVELAFLERLKNLYRLKMGKCCDHSFPSFLVESSSFFQVTWTCMKALMSSNFGQLPPPTQELAALERLEKSP